jgi:Family 4 glycosyl hydrolase
LEPNHRNTRVWLQDHKAKPAAFTEFAPEPRIAIVGAGGWTFPVQLVRDILSFPALAGGVLALYDIDAKAAELTAAAVRELIEIGGVRDS